MGVDVGDEDDVFGDGEFGEDGVDVFGEGAGVAVTDKELEAVQVVGSHDGVGVGEADFHTGRRVFGEAAVDGLEGELGALFVAATGG